MSRTRWSLHMQLLWIAISFPIQALSQTDEPLLRNGLYVAPNPCIAASTGQCTVRVSWHADRLAAGEMTQIWAGRPGEVFRLFSCSPAGETRTKPAPFVAAGKVTEFRLYRSSSGCNAQEPQVPPFAAVTATGLHRSISFPPASVGPNKIDLAMQYLGRASRGDGSAALIEVQSRLARKAIIDAARTGARFFRVAVSGYAPSWPGASSDLALWLRDPAAHWSRQDRMMEDLRASEMRVLASFAFNIRQFPAIAGETTGSFIKNPQSKSYLLFTKFVKDFIIRYRDADAIYAYEIGNEYNLFVDLDTPLRCRKKSEARCETHDIITTNDILAFTTRVAAFIRQLDPTKPISSGFSLPRPYAQNLRFRPEPVGGGFKLNNIDDLKQSIKEYSQAMDLVSVHYYSSHYSSFASILHAHNESDHLLLRSALDVAHSTGKKLYVGEFGDNTQPAGSRAASGPEFPFSTAVLRDIVRLGIPYSSPWIWEFYQSAMDITHRPGLPDSISIEPGYSDSYIEKITAANRAIGALGRPSGGPPNLVVTRPLPGDRLSSSGQTVFAVASADSGIADVRLLIDGRLLGSLTGPPFRFVIDAEPITHGRHIITVQATDRTGLHSEATLAVQDGVLLAPN